MALPDIQVIESYADGFDNLFVDYAISNASLPAFRLGIYRSADLSFGGDTLVDTINVANPLLLSIGFHTVFISIGAGANQMALPGAGAAESDTDYSLLVVADDNNLVAESDADPFNEDNTVPFAGVYHLP